jgi:protein TonB
VSSSSSLRAKVPLIAGAVISIAIIVGIGFFVSNMLDAKPTKPKKMVQHITFVKPPPPPPPKEEPPPEPEVQEEVDIPEPENEPDVADAPADDMPPMGDLGLDADGVAGSDGFGLLARKGGRDLLGSGGAGKFDWYAGVAQQYISEFLYDNEQVRRWKYLIILHLWIEPDGKVKKYKIVNSNSDKKIEKSLNLALAKLDFIHESPPENMPQPIKLKIVSRL